MTCPLISQTRSNNISGERLENPGFGILVSSSFTEKTEYDLVRTSQIYQDQAVKSEKQVVEQSPDTSI